MPRYGRLRVLVTGGAGFLGSHLCARLLKDGCQVICADNFFTGTRDNVVGLRDDPEFELLRHDVTFPLYVEVDRIYNLACPASPIHYQHDPVQTTKTSVHGAINMRCCFDSVRPLTRFDHLVADDADGGRGSREGHFLEWAKLINRIDDPAAALENARLNIASGFSIHYHVWDGNTWLDFLCRARDYLRGDFEIRHYELCGPEMISVLRRA